MMERIQVGLGDRAYEIVIGPGARALAADLTGRRNFLVTDSRVAELWGSWAAKEIPQAGSFVFPAGERHKTPETVVSICRRAAELRFDRKARFVALGGGVVGDMTGFAAAIYMRGAGFVQIPTTLLAMVDSSVGGKTGVDIPEGKNLIGAFHQPEQVLIDPDFLATLPPGELRCGLAEILKTGVIFDEALFAELERDLDSLTVAPDYARFVPLIRRSCELKAQVVAADEREAGIRALLNYGHTFGHAVELLSDFSIITGPFPAFPTDMQPLLMALLTLAKGHCMISETVFEARFSQAEGLCRMGADIRIEGRRASVFGVERLFGAEVFARDLRCGAALLCAALAAEGESLVHGAEYVERGYEKIETALSLLGGEIRLTEQG